MQIHVTGEFGIFIEGHIEFDLTGVAVISHRAFHGNRFIAHGQIIRVGSIEVELLVFRALEREFIFRTADLIIAVIGIHNVKADTRSHFPAIVDILQVAVIEALQVFQVFRLVGIRPFEIPVGTQPLQLGLGFAESLYGSAQMEMGEAGCLVNRADDLREIGAFVFPVSVHQRIFHSHIDLAVNAAGPGNLSGNELIEGKSRDTAFIEGFAVKISGAFPRGDALQVRRLHGSDTPLMHRYTGVPCHTDVAVAPVLHAQPFHEIITVFAVLMREHVDVAFGVAGTADINVRNSVTLIAPVHRIRRFKFREFGNGVGRYAHDLPFAHTFTRALAKPGPGDDGRIFLAFILRTVNITVDGNTVAHLHRHILFAEDAGSTFVNPLVERRAETLPHTGHRVVGVREVNARIDSDRFTGDHVDRIQFFTLEGFTQGKAFAESQFIVMIRFCGGSAFFRCCGNSSRNGGRSR